MSSSNEAARRENVTRNQGMVFQLCVLDPTRSDAAAIKDRIVDLQSQCFLRPDGADIAFHQPGTKLKSIFHDWTETCFVFVERIDRETGAVEIISGLNLVRMSRTHPFDVLTGNKLTGLDYSFFYTRHFVVPDAEHLGIGRFGVAATMLLAWSEKAHYLEALILRKLRLKQFLLGALHFKLAARDRYVPPQGDVAEVRCDFQDGHPVDLLPIWAPIDDRSLASAWYQMQQISSGLKRDIGVEVKFDDCFTAALESCGVTPDDLRASDFESPRPRRSAFARPEHARTHVA